MYYILLQKKGVLPHNIMEDKCKTQSLFIIHYKKKDIICVKTIFLFIFFFCKKV